MCKTSKYHTAKGRSRVENVCDHKIIMTRQTTTKVQRTVAIDVDCACADLVGDTDGLFGEKK